MSDFGRHFAALIGQVLDAPTDIEPQKLSLKGLRDHSRDAAHFVGLDSRGHVIADHVVLDERAPGVGALASQLSGHHLVRLDFEAGVTPAELLTVARLLAQPPAAERPGHSFATKLDGNAIAQVMPTITRASLVTPVSASTVAAATSVPDIVNEEDGGSLIFAAVRAPTGSAQELLERLAATRDVNVTSRLLDELGSVIEESHRDQRAEQVVSALAAIVDGEEREQDKELKRAWTAAFRRLDKPTIFALVANSMVQRRERIAPAMRILVRAGSGGWEALLNLLREAQGQHDRSIYTDALVHHSPPAAVLVDALDDFRWFAVRNVCELVGELGLKEAVPQLIKTLKHADERVRLAAAYALARLGTSEGVAALRAGLRDPHPSIRLMAAQAFAALRTTDATRILIAALETEKDVTTEAALLSLVGKSGTPLGLQYLVEMAAPSKGLFARKAADGRIAAIRAIGEMRTPGAVEMLKAYEADKDPKVAEAAKMTARMVDRRTRSITAGTLEAIKDV